MIKIIELKLRIFGFSIDLNIKRIKTTKKETPTNDYIEPVYETENAETLPSEDNIFTDEELNTYISNQARIFEEELKTSPKYTSDGLYDILSASDIPPRHNIQDDVEIITESFEKEIEDIYVGKR